jgi:hypothetical protein
MVNMRRFAVTATTVALATAGAGPAHAYELVSSSQERVFGACEFVAGGPSTTPGRDLWVIRAYATSTALALPTTTATWVKCWVSDTTRTTYYGHAVAAVPGPHVETHSEFEVPHGAVLVCLDVGMVDEWGNEGNVGDKQVCRTNYS